MKYEMLLKCVSRIKKNVQIHLTKISNSSLEKTEYFVSFLFHPSHHPKNGKEKENELVSGGQQTHDALNTFVRVFLFRALFFIIILYFVNFIHVVQHLLLLFCVTSRRVNKT